MRRRNDQFCKRFSDLFIVALAVLWCLTALLPVALPGRAMGAGEPSAYHRPVTTLPVSLPERVGSATSRARPGELAGRSGAGRTSVLRASGGEAGDDRWPAFDGNDDIALQGLSIDPYSADRGRRIGWSHRVAQGTPRNLRTAGRGPPLV